MPWLAFLADLIPGRAVRAVAAAMALCAALWLGGMWIVGQIEEDALEGVEDANEETTEDALQGIYDGATCRRAGGVWRATSGGGGVCLPLLR